MIALAVCLVGLFFCCRGCLIVYDDWHNVYYGPNYHAYTVSDNAKMAALDRKQEVWQTCINVLLVGLATIVLLLLYKLVIHWKQRKQRGQARGFEVIR